MLIKGVIFNRAIVIEIPLAFWRFGELDLPILGHLFWEGRDEWIRPQYERDNDDGTYQFWIGLWDGFYTPARSVAANQAARSERASAMWLAVDNIYIDGITVVAEVTA